MDNNLREEVAIEKVVIDAERNALLELNDLQLVFVGGGIAELVGV
jgi:hypothetical protein